MEKVFFSRSEEPLTCYKNTFSIPGLMVRHRQDMHFTTKLQNYKGLKIHSL